MYSAIKTVGRSGQISLGKQYAGRQIRVEEARPGVWTLTLGVFVPENEHWLHEPAVAESLQRAVKWAETHPPAESDLEQIKRSIEAE